MRQTLKGLLFTCVLSIFSLSAYAQTDPDIKVVVIPLGGYENSQSVTCFGTYLVNRVSSQPISNPPTPTDQRWEMWTFSRDGTFHAGTSTTRSLVEAPFTGVPGVSMQGTWREVADGTVQATYFWLDDFVELGVLFRFDVGVLFASDCSTIGNITMSLREYDPKNDDPLDPNDGAALTQVNTVTGRLVTTPGLVQ